MNAGISLSRFARPGLVVLASLPLLFGSCDLGPGEDGGSSSAPVSFRLQGARGALLPAASVVQIRAWVDDTIPLDSQRFEWTDGRAVLAVPLNRPLRFQLDGIVRRSGRDVVAWTATGADTLRHVRQERSVITLQWVARDTAAPDAETIQASNGASLSVDTASGTLSVVLPVGLPRTVLRLPGASIDSLYVSGQPVPAVDGAFAVEVARGDARTMLLVGKNRATTELRLAVRSGDVVGPAFTLSAGSAATRSLAGDTTVFTLPYVVASPPELRIGRADPADAIGSIALDDVELDASLASWSIAVDVPPATPAGARTLKLQATDSVGNASTRWIRFRREPSTRRTALEWIDAPGPEPLGARTATFVLRVSGGDSLLEPRFAVRGLNDPAVKLLAADGDTTWWQCAIALLDGDSGVIAASVSNRLDITWILDPVPITRFDPQGTDATAPMLAITSPSGGSSWTRSGGTTRIEGRAFDERGGKVDVRVRIGQRVEPAAWTASDSSWSFVLAWSGDGDTTLVIDAADGAGNVSAGRTVRLRRDARPPVLSWTTASPSRGDTVFCTGGSLRLALQVTDSGGAVSRVAAVRAVPKDSLSAEADPLRSDFWNAPLDVKGLQGASPWVLVATDSAGNRTTRDLVVFRDTIAPRITRQQPVIVDDSVAARSSVEVVFQVVDSSGVDSVVIDGESLPVNAGGIYARSILAPVPGSSRIVRMVAWDRLGNRSVDSSLRIVARVAAPALARGVPPGATAREFFFDAVCPDAGAGLQEQVGSDWIAWNAPRFVAATASLRLRCAFGSAFSPVATFAWTSADTSHDLPAQLSGIPDSGWALASDTAGTIWIVTSQGKAWYWRKGDSSWRATPSPLTAGGRLIVADGHDADGAKWIVEQMGDHFRLAAIGDSTIAAIADDALPPSYPASGPIVASVGRQHFAIAWKSSTSVIVQSGSNQTPSNRRILSPVGYPVLHVAGIVQPAPGSFTTLVKLGAGDSVGVFHSEIDAVFNPMNPPRPVLIDARNEPGHIALQKDGAVLIGTSSLIVGFRGSLSAAGAIYRFADATMSTRTDSIALTGLASAWAHAPNSGRLWLGTSSGLVSAPPVQVFPTAPFGTPPALPARQSQGCSKIAATPWGSGWAVMAADGLPRRIHRYHPR